MPELPEVETIVRQLDRILPGKIIEKVEVLRAKSFVGKENELTGKKITKVGRRAKMIVIEFKDWPKVLTAHLKMTGQLVYLSGGHRVVGGHPTPDWVRDLPSRHTRVVVDLDGGAKLFFNDLRVFGWLKIMTEDEWQKMGKRLPPDVIDKEFTLEYFTKALGKSSRAVKLTLTDQDKFGGVGNIYANDALYLARIDPRRKAKGLSDKERKRLYAAVKKVINVGIKYGGASVDKYVNTAGLGGKYQEHFLVYRREGEKCARDGETIKRLKLGGRGTFYCPKCQK